MEEKEGEEEDSHTAAMEARAAEEVAVTLVMVEKEEGGIGEEEKVLRVILSAVEAGAGGATLTELKPLLAKSFCNLDRRESASRLPQSKKSTAFFLYRILYRYSYSAV